MKNLERLKMYNFRHTINLSFWSLLIIFFFTNEINAQRQGGADLDPNINGKNVGLVIETFRTTVKHTWTKTGDKTWTRKAEGSTTSNNFQEKDRDAWSVFLTDSQGKEFQIDLWQKKVSDLSTGEAIGDIIQVALQSQVTPDALPTENWTAYQPSTKDYFQIIAENGKAFDVAGSSIERGTNVLLWNKTNNPNQLFKFIAAEKKGYYEINTALAENRFLHYTSSRTTFDPNIAIVGHTYGAGSYKLEKNEAGYIRFSSSASGFFLGADASENILILRSNQGVYTKFKLVKTNYQPPVKIKEWVAFKPSTKTFFQILNKNGKALDILGSKPESGKNVLLWSKTKNSNQIFKFVPAANGYYKIETALEKDKVLSIYLSRTSDGTNIILNHLVGNNQHFKLEKNKAGHVRFVSALGKNLFIGADEKNAENLVLRNGFKDSKTTFDLSPIFYIAKITTSDLEKRNSLGEQTVTSRTPPTFNKPTGAAIYEGIKNKKEIDINGLGRCYDIRQIDPLQWTQETLKSQRSARVFDFFRDNQTRQFDFNQKQYAVPMGVSVVHDSRGKGEVSYKHVITANQFENSVLQEYRLGVGIPKVASAKASIGFKNTNGGSSKNSNMFTFTKQLATYYKTDIQTDHPTYTHKLDDIFYDGVRQLGHTMSANEFVQNFGTHFASTTAYGGNFLQRTTISQQEYAHYSKNEREFKLDVEATIKKINVSAGTTQGSTNSNSNSQSVMTSNMELLTVGGDPNIQNPTKWSKTVKNNPTVIEVQLTSLATLLTAKYFPNIPNIAMKQKLLLAAISEKVKEAKNQMSRLETHSFFTKMPMEFEFKVTAIECVNEGDKHSDGDFFGELDMGFFGKEGSTLSESRFMYLSNDDHDFEMYKGQRLSVENATGESGILTKKVMPGRDMEDGYVQIWGWMKEDDDPDDDMGSLLKGQKNNGAISYQEAMVIGRANSKMVDFQKGNDHVRIHYQLLRTK